MRFAAIVRAHTLFRQMTVYQDFTADNDSLFLSGQGALNIYEPAYGGLPAAFTDGTPLVDSPEQTTEDRGLYANDHLSIRALRINLGIRADETRTERFLKPRQGEQLELGVKYQPPGTRTYVTFAYFDIEESNLPNPTSPVTDPELQQDRPEILQHMPCAG